MLALPMIFLLGFVLKLNVILLIVSIWNIIQIYKYKKAIKVKITERGSKHIEGQSFYKSILINLGKILIILLLSFIIVNLGIMEMFPRNMLFVEIVFPSFFILFTLVFLSIYLYTRKRQLKKKLNNEEEKDTNTDQGIALKSKIKDKKNNNLIRIAKGLGVLVVFIVIIILAWLIMFLSSYYS